MENLASLKTELAEGILTITLDNPEGQNSLSTTCIAALREAIQEVYVRVIWITSTPCAIFGIEIDSRALQHLGHGASIRTGDG